MTAISGTRRAIKELVDGTVRVQIDIDPQFRKRFFEMFPDIDMPVALAPLRPEPSFETDVAIVGAAKEAVKGGDLSKLAGMLCQDAAFQEWMWLRRHEDATPTNDFGTKWAEDWAAATLRGECGVESRAEFDHNPESAALFHERIRKPWNRYCQGEAGNCA